MRKTEACEQILNILCSSVAAHRGGRIRALEDGLNGDLIMGLGVRVYGHLLMGLGFSYGDLIIIYPKSYFMWVLADVCD